MSPAWLAALLLAPPAVDVPRTDGWVVLPVGEYRDLRARGPTRPRHAGSARVRGAADASSTTSVAGDSATGRARLHVDVLREGWVRVPAPAGLLVREARLDGRPVPLLEAGPDHPAPEALLSRTGRAVLELDVVIPVASSAGTESIVVPSSTAALTRGDAHAAAQGVDLQAAGRLVLETSEGESSRFVAHGRTAAPWTLSWRRRVDDWRASVPLRLRVRHRAGRTGGGVRAGERRRWSWRPCRARPTASGVVLPRASR